MEFLFGEKLRHAKLRKNPELARNTGFWGEIKNPVAFVERDVETAVSAVKAALEAGVRHEKLRDVCRHVVGKMGADEALRALGVHRDRKTRRAVLDVLGHRVVTEVEDPDLRKALLEEVEDPERLLRVLAELNDEKVARDFLRKKKREILSHDGALRELARNPVLLKIALEEEWHGEMSPAQLRRVGAALTSGGSFSPAEAFEIIANTLEKDIKSKEAARATAILLKDIVKSQDTTRIGQVERLMEKISEHVFRKDGTVDKKFGIELLHAAGPEFATAVLRLAKHLYEKGDYDGAAKKIWQALWLVKEAVKHHDRGIHGKHHRMFGEGGDVEEYVRKREAQLVRTFVQILSTPHLKEIDDTDPHHDQILRTLEYLGRRREVLGAASEETLRRLGRHLAEMDADGKYLRAILKIAVRDRKAGGLLLKSYLKQYPAGFAKARAKLAKKILVKELGMPEDRALEVLKEVNVHYLLPRQTAEKIVRRYGKEG